VGAEQVVIEGVWVIPVEFTPFVEGKLWKVLVVRIHVDECDGRSGQQIRDIAGDG